MRLILLTLTAALAGPPAPPLPPVDLDGDGKPETLQQQGEALKIGAASVDCGMGFGCKVRVVDVREGDGFREVEVCNPGPRDDYDCYLYAYRKGSVTALGVDGSEVAGSGWTITGNGIPLKQSDQRIYTRLSKYVLSKDGLSLTAVPQPFYYVGYKVRVDRTFPITMQPGGGAVVANVKPGSDITILLESAEHDSQMLVHLSSGLTGWVDLWKLVEASDSLMPIFAAG